MARTNNPMIAGKIVIYLLYVFIVLLVLALTGEYQSNAYQQSWIQANAPWLQYVVNGYIAAALFGIMIGGFSLLVWDIRKSRNRKTLKTMA